MWLLKNIYYLEKVPSKHYKVLSAYIQTMHESSKSRVRDEATEMLENKDDIPFDDLEKQLINEAETSEERNEL